MEIVSPSLIKVTKIHRYFMESPLGQATSRNIEKANDVTIVIDGTNVKIYGQPTAKEKCVEMLLSTIDDSMKSAVHIDLLQYGECRFVVCTLQKKFGPNLNALEKETGSVVGLDTTTALLYVKGNDAKNLTLKVLNRFFTGLAQETYRTKDVSIDDELIVESICSVCLSNPQGCSLQLGLCGHTYCWEYLAGHVTSGMANKTIPILCTFESCQKPILWQDIQLIIRNRDIINKFLHTSLSMYISNNQDAVSFCVTPGCEMFYYTSVHSKTSTVVCTSCSKELCNVCRTPSHNLVSCSVNKLRSGNFREDLKEWMNQKTDGSRKMCPKCSHCVEKYIGFDQVVCAACRTHFCWNCEVYYDHRASFHICWRVP